jgi:hypothetical protein
MTCKFPYNHANYIFILYDAIQTSYYIMQLENEINNDEHEREHIDLQDAMRVSYQDVD